MHTQEQSVHADVDRRGGRRRLAARGAAAAVFALAAVMALVGVRSGDAPPDRRAQEIPATKPDAAPAGRWGDGLTLRGPTDTTLLFDSGTDNVLAVDLDAGVFARRSLEGHVPGDQPFRLWRTADALVVGWGDIFAVSMATGRSRSLAEATVFLPAAEPGHVWLIDYPGGRVGRESATYRLVNLSGEVVRGTTGVADRGQHPVRGVAGGLIAETEDGLVVRDAQTGAVTRHLGGRSAMVSDAEAQTVVWCEADCARLHVTDLDGGERVLDPPAGFDGFDAVASRLSPDGGRLGVILLPSGSRVEEKGAGVAVANLETGQVSAVTGPLDPAPSNLGWSPDGRQLFFSTYSYGSQQTGIGRFSVDDGRVETATLPVGGALSFVPLARHEAGAFLEGATSLPGR